MMIRRTARVEVITDVTSAGIGDRSAEPGATGRAGGSGDSDRGGAVHRLIGAGQRLVRGLGSPGGRRVAAGLADQALVALTSAGTGLLAAVVLDRAEAGRMQLALLFLIFVQGIGRAFVGDVMLTYVARFTDERERRRQFANAHATALLLAGAAMIVLLSIWSSSRVILGDLIWGIPFVPAILLQDLARYTYQTLRQQPRALLIDTCWVVVQGSGVAALLATGRATGGALLVCWGLGASAGATVFYARTRLNPLSGRPAQWVADTRHLLGWFTATGVLAQLTTLLVGTLVQGLLARRAFAGFRLIQIVVLQPAQSLALALNGLLVPRASQLAGAGDAAGLRAQTRRVLAINSAIGLTIVVVAALAAHPVLDHFKGGRYADVAVIAVPVALQAWAYLMQIAFTVAIRGMHRGRYLFIQYLIFTITSVGGLVIGAERAQLSGAAWGLFAGAVVGLAVQAYMYGRAVRGLKDQQVSGGGG